MAKKKSTKSRKPGRKADPYSFPFGANVKRGRRRKPTGGGS